MYTSYRPANQPQIPNVRRSYRGRPGVAVRCRQFDIVFGLDPIVSVPPGNWRRRSSDDIRPDRQRSGYWLVGTQLREHAHGPIDGIGLIQVATRTLSVVVGIADGPA